MLLAALPILIELFTSEGCSSCPPADAVLARLHEKQPVPGVELLVLSEHVDYWNSLGWRDPFSAAEFTARQERYGRMYTPQAIVDGRIDVLGSDEAGLVEAAKAAAGEPHGRVTCSVPDRKRNNLLLFSAAVTDLPPHGAADVLVAAVDDGLTSQVERGENAGRTLHHTAVVRALVKAGTIPAGQKAWKGEVEVPAAKRYVLFVQDSARVLAAGSPER